MSWHFACSLSISPRAPQRPEMCRRQGRDMSLVKRVIAALLLTGAAALLLASSTLAQERVGVVTTIEGFATVARVALPEPRPLRFKDDLFLRDRKSTRLNSSHLVISYAVFCLKKQKERDCTYCDIINRSNKINKYT